MQGAPAHSRMRWSSKALSNTNHAMILYSLKLPSNPKHSVILVPVNKGVCLVFKKKSFELLIILLHNLGSEPTGYCNSC